MKHHQSDDFKDDSEEEDKKKEISDKKWWRERGGCQRTTEKTRRDGRETKTRRGREDEAQEIEAGSWPFTRTCEFLAFSLFSSRWEDRHGAAVALREIFAVPSGMREYFHRNVRYYYGDKC